MKKLFNHTKRPVPEWENIDESSYDWDEVDMEPQDNYDAEEAVTADGEDDWAYYAETEYGVEYEDVEGDSLEYNGFDEDDFGGEVDEEGYYAEESEADEDGYYAEASEADEEGYYAEVSEVDEEGYYAETSEAGEEGYYAETSEAFAEDYYMEDAGGDSTYAEQVYEAGEDDAVEVLPMGKTDRLTAGSRPAGRASRNKKSLFARMDLMDRVIVGTGVTVLILALATGVVYISSSIKMNQISAFADVGSQLNDIHVIGEAGLLAVADAHIARLAAADIVHGDQQQNPEDEQPGEGYQEVEFRREVQVAMEFTSIQKDLKIKFVNEKTGKLVANVPFSVTVTDPDGKNLIWSDDDMDGIIYKKDIVPGNYKVLMEALTDQRYASYSVSTMTRTVAVKKEIDYQKVAVGNEIKSEDEIDASKEDTKKNEKTVESALQDTVAWVESSVIAASYTEVAKSSIPVPTSLALSKSFIRAAEVGSDTVTGGDAGDKKDEEDKENKEDKKEEELPQGRVKLAPATVSVVQGGTITSQADVEGFASGKNLIYSISSDSNQYAKAVIDNTGKITVTGIEAGSTRFTVKVNYAENGTADTEAEATLNVSVTPPKTLTLDQTAATAYIGDPLVLTAEVPNTVTPEITAVSQDESIATVSVNQTKVTVNGVKAGVVNITVSLTENNTVVSEAICVVTVKENPKNDKVSLLKDENDNQLYVQENGEYRMATFADYYVESYKFYIMREARYTGWQTIGGKTYYFTAQGEKVTGEQVIQGARYQFASDGSLVQGTGALGIDVSKHNGNIDWNAVKKSGVNYVIIRCGYRGYTSGSLVEDPMFVTNIKGATAAGLKVGIYFFSQAMDEREAVEEASMVLELVKNYTISYPIFLDVEASGGRADAISKSTRTAVCKAFCQTIKNAGYTSGIYANKYWLENYIDASALGAYKIWLAQYAATPTYTGRYEMWQYRSTGTVSGIKGDVDMNLSYLGY